MRLTDAESRRLVDLRLAGLSHQQAIRRIKIARKPMAPSEAQLRHRAQAAAALKLSQDLGVSLKRGWELLSEPTGYDGPNFGIRSFELPTEPADLTTSE